MFKYRFRWEKINKDDGFIVQLFFLFFYILERISVFYWVRMIAKTIADKRGRQSIVHTYIFPELWVVGNIAWALFGYHVIVPYLKIHWLLNILTLYAILRIFEMFVYQVNVLFFHRLNAVYLEARNPATTIKNQTSKNQPENKTTINEYAIKSATRTVLLLLINMVEYVLQFAVILAVMRYFLNVQQSVGVNESFHVFMSLSEIENLRSIPMLLVVQIETLLGMFMNILCLARFVGMLPEVNRLDKN